MRQHGDRNMNFVGQYLVGHFLIWRKKISRLHFYSKTLQCAQPTVSTTSLNSILRANVRKKCTHLKALAQPLLKGRASLSFRNVSADQILCWGEEREIECFI